MPRRRLTVETAPNADLVATAIMKNFLRVDADDENALIDSLVDAATAHLDGPNGILGRALITQVWNLSLDRFPVYSATNPWEAISIPLPPLQSVQSITHVDTAGATQTLASSVYTVDIASQPGRVYPAYNQEWPEVRDIPNAVTIQFTAGYGDAASNVPDTIITAVKQMVAHWFDNRPAVEIGTIATEVPMGVRRLLAPYMIRP